MPESERILSLDVLRGVALLGILTINIRYFALPLRRLNDPSFPGDELKAADFWVWLLGNVFLEDKMIALFSMLFGAGIILLSRRLGHGTSRVWKVYFRRMFWLFVIGLLHAFLLWFGDILMTYALCGLVLYFLRRLPPWPLLAAGCLLVIFAPARTALPAVYQDFASPPAASLSPTEVVKPPGETPPPPEPSPFSEEIQTQAYRGSYSDLFVWRAEVVRSWHFLGVFDFDFWRCGGFMLIGMGLFSMGFLSASRPLHVYWGVLAAGLSVGLALVVLGITPQWQRVLYGVADWPEAGRRMLSATGQILRHLAPLFLAPAYASAVILLCRCFRLRALASVGRMALTNYLMQTVFCVLIFEGWALGWWGRLGQAELWMVVLPVWIFQLLLSTAWIQRFRFGPIEWLWRSLAYGKTQPMRRRGLGSLEPPKLD